MDPYSVISQYYDLEHGDFRDDVEFVLNMVHRGPVLEVGVGTGRLAEPLADAGFEVWGVDSSVEMIEHARTRLAGRNNVHLVPMSLADLSTDTEFASVVMPLNTLWHFPSLDAQLHALQAVRRHCQNSALLLVDQANPLTMADRGSHGEVRQRFLASDSRGEVRSTAATWDDPAEQQLDISLVYDLLTPDGTLRRTSTEFQLRYVFRAELELLLQLAGFRVANVYGSYDLEPYHASSTNLIATAWAV